MTFFNIFSNKPIEEKKPKIIIDKREKNSLVASELVNLGINIEFQHLPVADYLVNNIAIERKTVADLKSSIINKRILSQLTELKQYSLHLLLIEGIQDEDIYAGIIHENALRGFLLSVALDYQISTIYTKNEKDTAKYLAVLAKKQTNLSPSLRPSKIALTREKQIQFILEGFPHIGPVKAKKLIEKFHSIKNIANAQDSELQEILGNRTKDFKDLIE